MEVFDLAAWVWHGQFPFLWAGQMAKVQRLQNTFSAMLPVFSALRGVGQYQKGQMV